MPAAFTDMPALVKPPVRRLTRADCEALSSSGLLGYENFELVDGELISTMGKNRPYTNALMALRYWLDDVFGRQRVNHATPIDVAPDDNATNEPEPDLIVLTRDSYGFQQGHPRPADILLVVEIS